MQEELDRVDTLRYMWQKLIKQVAEVQNTLLRIQGEFRTSLLEKVVVFKRDTHTFVEDYTNVSGMINAKYTCMYFCRNLSLLISYLHVFFLSPSSLVQWLLVSHHE